MHAVIVIGHGSLRSASGASMIRIAARLRELDFAPVVEACFLNYSRPTLAETVAKCVERGVRIVTLQPYFLIAGAYVRQDLPALVRNIAQQYPRVDFNLATPFQDHPALIELATKRARAAIHTQQPTAPYGLLLMAHGTPLEEANAPLYTIAQVVGDACGSMAVAVGYLDCNAPDIPTAGAQLQAAGCESIVALPYFLHLGRHVREDLPQQVEMIRATGAEVHLTQHLDYDLLLVDAIVDRARQIARTARDASYFAGGSSNPHTASHLADPKRDMHQVHTVQADAVRVDTVKERI